MKRTRAKRPLKCMVAQYPVVVQEDEAGGYWVSCPLFEGCYSQGETIEDALINIKEAIALCREELQPKRSLVSRNVSLHFVPA